MSSSTGKLYLVPTPIGNMSDITQRALDVLRAVDFIACEDTRHSGGLLKKLGISSKLISYHAFNEAGRANQIVESLAAGSSAAVITDAGSPGISDPAYRVVRTAIDNGIEVIPLPGPCAIIPALTASGLPADRFFFEGFLPNKSGARRTRLGRLIEMEHTLVFYESPHRIQKTISDALEVLGDRQACIAREITKLHEQFIRGSLSEISADIADRTIKGEIVLMVEGKHRRAQKDTDQ